MNNTETKERLENTIKDLDRRIMQEVDLMRYRMLAFKLTGMDIVSAKHFIDWFGKDSIGEWVKMIANATPANIQVVNQQIMETYFKEKDKQYDNCRIFEVK